MGGSERTFTIRSHLSKDHSSLTSTMFHLLKKPGIDSGCLFRFESPISDSQETFALDKSLSLSQTPDMGFMMSLDVCITQIAFIDLGQLEEIL